MQQFENDLELINNIKNNTCADDSIKELELRHSGICHQMIKKYYSAFVEKGIDPFDVSEEKNYIIYKSALNFNPDKNVKFSTWLGNQMRYHCLNCLNDKDNSVFLNGLSLEKFLDCKQQVVKDENYMVRECEYVLDLIKQLKDKRIEKIFKMRYFSDSNKKFMSWSKIGKKLNISTQTVINLHDKTIKTISNKLKGKNFIDKI
jgi:RNA polymerase sigma factor (sigma-70 family)